MGSLTIAILLSLAALTRTERQKSNNIDELVKTSEIGSVLQQILAQSPLGDSLGDAAKHHSKHHKNHKNPNLVNIQNLNLIFKNNNLRKKLAKAEHSQVKNSQKKPDQKMLRDIEDAICETTGRCGCSGTRCGCSGDRCDDDSKVRARNNNELSKLLDSLQNNLENDQSLPSNLRCGCGNNRPQRGHKYNLRCGCRGRIPYQRTSKNKDKDSDEPGKKIAIDDNLDVVVLELNDLLDEKTKSQDYTRTKDENIPRKVNSQLDSDDKSNDEVIGLNKNNNRVSPEDMFNHYQLFKARTIDKLKNYILYQKNDIDISKLSKRQQEIVKDLQEEIPKLKAVDTRKLEDRLISLLFGPESAVEVLPHGEKNENIYVPQWAFYNMRSGQANPPILQAELPRKKSTRSIFPLTKKQKLKLQKIIQKQQSDEAAKRLGLLRRSFTEELQNYGAPFELDIQGLGQVNS